MTRLKFFHWLTLPKKVYESRSLISVWKGNIKKRIIKILLTYLTGDCEIFLDFCKTFSDPSGPDGKPLMPGSNVQIFVSVNEAVNQSTHNAAEVV